VRAIQIAPGVDFLARVCVRESASMPDEKSTGVRAQQSLNVEDMGGFPTPEPWKGWLRSKRTKASCND